MGKMKCGVLALLACLFLAACAKPAAQSGGVDYGQIRGDFSGVTPELAKAYLAVVDELSAHLGYEETEASAGECLHGGFVRDWDGDGVPELCLLLRTSPRDGGGWDGTPVYGWYPPTLYLYTYRGGQAVRAGECDLYFATGGREAAVAALTSESGVRYVLWDRSAAAGETYADCFALENGAVRKTELPADAAKASGDAETARAFLDALGAGKAQLLLYNDSGEARIEGEANAKELRAALAAKAA
jgi:hypothetical protein